eukprot:2534343-Rhodomonas_salina.7
MISAVTAATRSQYCAHPYTPSREPLSATVRVRLSPSQPEVVTVTAVTVLSQSRDNLHQPDRDESSVALSDDFYAANLKTRNRISVLDTACTRFHGQHPGARLADGGKRCSI